MNHVLAHKQKNKTSKVINHQNCKQSAEQNNTVKQLLTRHRIQPKLKISRPDDPLEREADEMADRVMGMRDAQAAGRSVVQAKSEYSTNSQDKTRLPGKLKNGIEFLSGYSMDDVKVHYNSPQPARLDAHAFTKGTDIHIAPGAEKHLPHEAWHVVQQKQGRVWPTWQLGGETLQMKPNKIMQKDSKPIQTKSSSKAIVKLLSFNTGKDTDTIKCTGNRCKNIVNISITTQQLTVEVELRFLNLSHDISTAFKKFEGWYNKTPLKISLNINALGKLMRGSTLDVVGSIGGSLAKKVLEFAFDKADEVIAHDAKTLNDYVKKIIENTAVKTNKIFKEKKLSLIKNNEYKKALDKIKMNTVTNYNDREKINEVVSNYLNIPDFKKMDYTNKIFSNLVYQYLVFYKKNYGLLTMGKSLSLFTKEITGYYNKKNKT